MSAEVGIQFGCLFEKLVLMLHAVVMHIAKLDCWVIGCLDLDI